MITRNIFCAGLIPEEFLLTGSLSERYINLSLSVSSGFAVRNSNTGHNKQGHHTT